VDQPHKCPRSNKSNDIAFEPILNRKLIMLIDIIMIMVLSEVLMTNDVHLMKKKISDCKRNKN